MTSLAPSLAALGFLAAAVCSAIGPPLRLPARALAALSAALVILPGLDVPSRGPSLALAAGAAALASPLACVLAAAGSLLVLLVPEAAGGSIAPALLALAASLAAGAVSSTLTARLQEGRETWSLAAVAGAGLVVLLMRLDGGEILRWGFALGSGGARLEMRGAGLLLGLALLACLGGTLLLVAHRLAPAVAGARELGLRLLLPGAALGLLAAAHITLRGLGHAREALAGKADVLVALVVLAGTLAAVLAGTLRVPPTDASSGDGWAERETALATSLAWLAVGVAGWECWRTEGTYLCAGAAVAVSTGLVGIAAMAPTALSGARRVLLLVALVMAVLFPGVLR